MNKEIIKCQKDSWYIFPDGSIGVLTIVENEYAIASGQPWEYHSYDFNLKMMDGAIKIGTVESMPDYNAVHKHLLKLSSALEQYIKNYKLIAK